MTGKIYLGLLFLLLLWSARFLFIRLKKTEKPKIKIYLAALLGGLGGVLLGFLGASFLSLSLTSPASLEIVPHLDAGLVFFSLWISLSLLLGVPGVFLGIFLLKRNKL